MDYNNNIEQLKSSMNMKDEKNGAKHKINVRAQFLPFQTREPERAKFKRRFSGVVGEVSRILAESELLEDIEIEKCIEHILEEVDFNDDNDKKYLRDIIKNYLINNEGQINIFHPHLFQYIKLTEKYENKNEAIGERAIARFVCDVILENDDAFKDIFNKNDTNHMITKLILSKLDGLKSNKMSVKYRNNLKYISDVAKEDIKFMVKKEDFFLKNFETVLAFYYFYYITQLVIKLNKRSRADYTKCEDIYYLLDWESASKNRRSVTKGYNFVKSENRNTLININLIEHLNFIFGVEGYNFTEIYNLFTGMEDEEQKKVLEALKDWIVEYRTFFNLNQKELNLGYEELVKELSDSLTEKIEQGPVSRYALSIEEIGKKYFLKLRGGTYGYMLNITQEIILIITAIIIKEKKITLKDLFKEYEKRGLFFDQYSKDLIVELLGKLNLIDKKSDSGDAQYVKAIL